MENISHCTGNNVLAFSAAFFANIAVCMDDLLKAAGFDQIRNLNYV
jgi:hypothetical protein